MATFGTTQPLELATPAGYGAYVTPGSFTILDDDVLRAPTSVVVIASGLTPQGPLEFRIDGDVVYPASADSDGELRPTSVPVDRAHGAQGVHTMTLVDGAFELADTFTVAQDPVPTMRTVGPDLEPVQIPGALLPTGVRKWVLQDLMPGGLGSYILPISPTTQDGPLVRRTMQARRSTAPTGKHHLYESGPEPLTWTVRGYCPDQAMADQLLAYGALSRRFYVIDHRNRAWKALFASVNLTPRKRQLQGGAFNDWAADYDITVLVYDDTWRDPQ